MTIELVDVLLFVAGSVLGFLGGYFIPTTFVPLGIALLLTVAVAHVVDAYVPPAHENEEKS